MESPDFSKILLDCIALITHLGLAGQLLIIGSCSAVLLGYYAWCEAQEEDEAANNVSTKAAAIKLEDIDSWLVPDINDCISNVPVLVKITCNTKDASTYLAVSMMKTLNPN